MVKENTTEAISLLLVEGVQINKNLDRMPVVMWGINIFKTLGFLWLSLSAEGWSVYMNHQHPSPGVPAWHLTLFCIKKERKNWAGDPAGALKRVTGWCEGQHDLLLQVWGLQALMSLCADPPWVINLWLHGLPFAFRALQRFVFSKYFSHETCEVHWRKQMELSPPTGCNWLLGTARTGTTEPPRLDLLPLL